MSRFESVRRLQIQVIDFGFVSRLSSLNLTPNVCLLFSPHHHSILNIQQYIDVLLLSEWYFLNLLHAFRYDFKLSFNLFLI